MNDELIRKRFGRLVVIKINNESLEYICKCDCGKEKITIKKYLIYGQTKSCGCLHKENPNKFKKTHGQSKTQAYRCWQAMKNRCLNSNGNRFSDWGGRGIDICDRWKQSFENFIEDMGNTDKGMSLERIDNERGYFKENCEWIPKGNQNKNKRSVPLVNLKGEMITLKEVWKRLNNKYCHQTIINKFKKNKLDDILKKM